MQHLATSLQPAARTGWEEAIKRAPVGDTDESAFVEEMWFFYHCFCCTLPCGYMRPCIKKTNSFC